MIGSHWKHSTQKSRGAKATTTQNNRQDLPGASLLRSSPGVADNVKLAKSQKLALRLHLTKFCLVCVRFPPLPPLLALARPPEPPLPPLLALMVPDR